MSHELTHALQDQHFHIDKWTDAAKPNDDAELARDAVHRGFGHGRHARLPVGRKGKHPRSRRFRSRLLMGDVDSSPELSKAPKVLQDELLFPYLAGIRFTQTVAEGRERLAGFLQGVREASGLHAANHASGFVFAGRRASPRSSCPTTKGVFPADWKKLDENNMGEFGLQEILKQFLAKDRATRWRDSVGRRPLRRSSRIKKINGRCSCFEFAWRATPPRRAFSAPTVNFWN